MTRTEITRRELAETERHNKQQEFIGKLGAIVDVGKMVYGKGGLAGLFHRGTDRDIHTNSNISNSSPNKTRSYNKRSTSHRGK